MRPIILIALLLTSVAHAAEVPQPDLPTLSTSTADLTNPAYLIELANAHLKFGAVQRAQPFLHKAMELSKDAAQRDSVLQSLRSTFQRLHDWPAAVALYQDLLPTAVNATERGKMNAALADAYVQTKDFDKAESILVELAKPDKERGDDQQQRQNAMNSLIQLLQANPDRVDATINQADADLLKNPDDSAALERMLRIYSLIKHDVLKETLYAEKLCALHPDDAGEQRRLAGLYVQDRKYDKAIDVNKRLLKSATKHEDSQQYALQIGNLLVQAGKRDDAVAWMHENFEPNIQRNGDYMLLSSFYENANLPVAADAALMQWVAAAKSPDETIEAYFRVAQLAFRLKNFAHAEEILHRLATDYKDRPVVLSRVGTLFQNIQTEKNKPVPPRVLVPPPIKVPVEER
jgi:tetratricopeptide (TPR) repeat protein